MTTNQKATGSNPVGCTTKTLDELRAVEGFSFVFTRKKRACGRSLPESSLFVFLHFIHYIFHLFGLCGRNVVYTSRFFAVPATNAVKICSGVKIFSGFLGERHVRRSERAVLLFFVGIRFAALESHKQAIPQSEWRQEVKEVKVYLLLISVPTGKVAKFSGKFSNVIMRLPPEAESS